MKLVKKKNLYKNLLKLAFDEHTSVIKETFLNAEENIKKAADMIAKSLVSGGSIFWCGNGGSAADSQHMAAEFIGRFKKDRKPLRSIALTTDTSVLTCISNDYSYDKIFSRQLNALGRKGDVLIAISTSGKSENIRMALIQARKMGLKTIGLLGKKGGKCKNYVDVPIIIPSNSTARIQEAHILIEHLLCELVEIRLGLN